MSGPTLHSENQTYVSDISDSVRRKGTHYVGIGEHADLWEGDFTSGSDHPVKVAIKVLRGGPTNNQYFLEKLKRRINQHARVWLGLKHENIARFHGIATNFGYMPALVLTFYPKGNVIDYLRRASFEDRDKAKLLLVQQIARGMEYLHDNGVVHGDIRGANVLIDEKGHAHLADYGLVFIIESSDFTSIKTAGTCRWTAPEIMNPPEEDPSEEEDTDDELGASFTTSSDVYAFSMTTIEIFTEEVPYRNKRNDSSVIFSVLAGNRPELPLYMQSKNQALGNLVKRCWDPVPAQRPSAKTIREELEPSTEKIEIPSFGWRLISSVLDYFWPRTDSDAVA